jgi:FdhE protein
VAKPPFAVVPDPLPLFEARSRRLAALAPGHRPEPYLLFLAEVAHAQYDVAAAASMPPAVLPPANHIAQALEHGLPPISYAVIEPDAVAMAAIERLLDRLAGVAMPAEAAAAIASLRTAAPEDRRRLARETLMDAEILYQVNDAALEPMADDVASLGLDMLLAEEGWKRGGHNPFLLGY